MPTGSGGTPDATPRGLWRFTLFLGAMCDVYRDAMRVTGRRLRRKIRGHDLSVCSSALSLWHSRKRRRPRSLELLGLQKLVAGVGFESRFAGLASLANDPASRDYEASSHSGRCKPVRVKNPSPPFWRFNSFSSMRAVLRSSHRSDHICSQVPAYRLVHFDRPALCWVSL